MNEQLCDDTEYGMKFSCSDEKWWHTWLEQRSWPDVEPDFIIAGDTYSVSSLKL